MKDLAKFKHTTEFTVRWGDMDAFRHVNNAVYIKWVEEARVDYLRHYVIGEFGGVGPGPILARQDCRYIFPVTYPDTVIVGFKVEEIQDDRLICMSKVYSKKYKKLAAIAYNTIMAYDFNSLSKTSIPMDWIMKIQEFED